MLHLSFVLDINCHLFLCVYALIDSKFQYFLGLVLRLVLGAS